MSVLAVPTPTRPNAIAALAAEATRVLFFTGKGGVGKTSIACAVAVALADAGRRILLVSTDPASNLDEVLGVILSDKPRPVPGAPGLDAMNIDPEVAAASYREAMVGPYRGVLPDAAVASMEEQLSGACTIEIAAFNEFASLVGDPSSTAGYDTIIFDTAPTGHTLRLLTLPSAWSEFIETNTTGGSCLGPLAGLSAYRELYARTVEALADPALTTLVLVSRPEAAALREAARSSAELCDLGVGNQRLVLNGLFSAARSGDRIADALEKRGAEALREAPAALSALPRVEVPLVVVPPVGLDGLRGLASARSGPQAASSTRVGPITVTGTESLRSLVDDIAKQGSGVVMTMGKGGVGKTTIAAAIAVELARRGFPVHLSTTDPAAHLVDALGDSTASLEVSRIDPEVEVAAYREQVLATTGAGLDPPALAMLEEDLRSPCTEEIAVFHAFARVVACAANGFVILDTAPTGHTLLLIDSSEAYHREVSRNTTDTPAEVLELLPRLRDPDFTKVLIVTLAEATPVSEARRLQDDLERAGIVSYAWVINQSLALVDTRDPVLRRRGAHEIRHIESVKREHASRTASVPWLPVAPVGEGLGALTK
jgi:arsenite-transporting ATPase